MSAFYEWSIEKHDDDEKPPCIDQWCCGCEEHPIGKPWGWNWEAWHRHYAINHPAALSAGARTEGDA